MKDGKTNSQALLRHKQQGMFRPTTDSSFKIVSCLLEGLIVLLL
jgi:hypothetical protein